jgi:hypothetical protein
MRQPTSVNTSPNRLPDFIIIGAMKAGTTSLFTYLEEHPQISGSAVKEPSFFAHLNWNKGLKWYQGLFPDNDHIKFEASTNYAKYPVFDNVPKRMHSHLPNVKLIYVVRHPVDRVVSQIHHLIVHRLLSKNEPLHTQEFWRNLGAQSVNVSRYYLQLSQYLKYYDLAQILVVRFEDLTSDPPKILNQILDFVGLEPTYFNDEMLYERHNVLTKRKRLRLKGLPGKLLRFALRQNINVVRRLIEPPLPKPALTPEIQQWIWSEIEDDLNQFEALIGRKLDYHAPPEVSKGSP